jgi:hypothetical protein
MKVKASFITNSSSTAYLVVIPKNFTIGLDIFSDNGEEYDCWKDELHYNCDDNKALMLEYLANHLQTLLNNESLWIQEARCFLTIRDYLQSKGLIFKHINIDGGSGVDTIEPMSIERLQEIVNRYYEMENFNNET